MTRETLAAAVLVWLIGALVGWCAGWAGRGEQNRGWHQNLVRQLEQTRAQLADALEQLDDAQAQWEPEPAPTTVHVHMSSPPPWMPRQPLAAGSIRALDAVPAEEVEP